VDESDDGKGYFTNYELGFDNSVRETQSPASTSMRTTERLERPVGRRLPVQLWRHYDRVYFDAMVKAGGAHTRTAPISGAWMAASTSPG